MSSHKTFVSCTLAILSIATLAGLGACNSSATPEEEEDSQGTGGSRSVPSTGGGSSLGGSGSVGTGGSTTARSTVAACHGVPFTPNQDGEGKACTGTGAEAEPSPLDLMMLMDRTQSMTYALPDGTPRWEALRAAVGQFVSDSGSQAIRVGVQFFSLTGNADLTRDCDANAYVTPAVEIGPLSQNAGPILAAMDALVLGGQTPSAPALQGVIWHAQDWQRTNLPGRKTAVLVITDGLPTMCPAPGNTEASVDDIVAVAASGLAGTDGPSIPTYVIGVAMGANSFNLNRIAASGGSRSAYLTGEGGDTTAALVSALRSITDDPLACEYQMPNPTDELKVVDPSLVRVIHTDGAGNQEEVPTAGTRGGCSQKNGGWYYDDQEQPTKIIMCPCTCANFSAGRISIEVGCMAALPPLG